MKSTPETPLLSRSQIVGFRPGMHLRAELEKLLAELIPLNPRLTISDILREGVTFYWPHIRAYLTARARHPEVPPPDLQKIVTSALRAHRRGLAPREISASLRRALAAKGRTERRKHPALTVRPASPRQPGRPDRLGYKLCQI